jgi:two-component system, OmpR family, alkaline phosphatase synthesis response regulator PhoP
MTDTILVIEDERLTRNNLVNFLRSEGFETLSAENGRQGIQLAQMHLPDLIICDIMMPELDGYDVLATLQGNVNTSGIPFIFLTVTADEIGYQQSIEMGADDYLRKPITSEDLRHAIATQLRKRHAKQAAPFRFTTAQTPHGPSENNLTDLVQAKDVLFSEICKTLLVRLSHLRQTVEQVQSLSITSESLELTQNLQAEFTRLLGFVNEVSVLHRMITPENADLLLKEFFRSHPEEPNT